MVPQCCDRQKAVSVGAWRQDSGSGRPSIIEVLYKKENPASELAGFSGINPGDDLLSHRLGGTTIGASAFHFRVRDGIGWFHSANFTRETVGASPAFGSRVLRE